MSQPDVFLATSMEVTPILADPIFGNTEAGIHHSLVVVGIYSTYANAEAALDARNARFAKGTATPTEQFAPYGQREWRRDMATPFGGTAWQMIELETIDARP